MSHFSRAARHTLTAVQAIKDGDTQAVTSDMNAVTSSMNAGSRAIAATGTDINRLNAS